LDNGITEAGDMIYYYELINDITGDATTEHKKEDFLIKGLLQKGK
jgi:hypothetical protein